MKSVINSRTLQSLASRARIARVVVAGAFAVLFVAGCSSSTDFSPITSVTISPTSATIPVGGTQQFTAVTKDGRGTTITTTTPTWSVTGGGTITNTGLFTAGATPGTSTISVTCTGVTATATVTVNPGPLATITVTPNPATLPISTNQQFTAVGKDANGNVVAITPVWSVVNPVAGTIVAGSGLFTSGTTTGTYTNTVVATSGALSGSATVIVTAGALFSITVTPNPDSLPPNAQQQFTAVGKDAGGNVVPITPVWSVTAGGGTIVAGSGLFTAGAATGTFPNTVRATQGSVFGTATVVVSATAPVPIVGLGNAAPFGILAGTTVTCITGGIVNAEIGIYPGNALTGFGPCTSGATHLGDAVAQSAQNDLTTAYNTLAGLPCPGANVVGTANIGGTTKAAGVYCSASSMLVTGNLTLDGGGDPNAVFVFQAGSTLTTAGNIILINGAQAKNVYWQVGSSATLGLNSAWQGNILALSSITLNDNVTLTGRALARNAAVTLGNNNVITLP
jgi:Ice-binding-like